MSFTVHGIPAAKGIAIGRAVRVVSSRANVAHYYIDADQTQREISRVRQAKRSVMTEMQRLQATLQVPGSDAHSTQSGSADPGHKVNKRVPGKDATHELHAIIDVHLMLLDDETLADGVKHWIEQRHYNAEWALTTQLEIIAAQFDEMQDAYMRERKSDLEQVVELLLAQLQGQASTHLVGVASSTHSEPLVMVAHDLSPAAMLQFKSSVFAGFVTDVGGTTSHTAIVARSMGIPAVVGAKSASSLVHQDDWVIVDGEQGVLIVDPSPLILDEYRLRQSQWLREQGGLQVLLHTDVANAQAEPVAFLANIEEPSDAAAALKAGAQGIGLFRTEFLFMDKGGQLPGEQEQYQAYKTVLEAFAGKPVTIRTIDVGADKPMGLTSGEATTNINVNTDSHLNPALGLRAIRWCLAEPAMFLIQLKALLRAAVHGDLHVLIPMLAHESEIKQCMLFIDRARLQLDAQGVPYGNIMVGAMIEVPAAALIVPTVLQYSDFPSIGTNDLIQYTLAIDRADESVAHLYDPWHPAVQGLIASTIAHGKAASKPVSVCGEMAGDPAFTAALMAMGLTQFSMHPSQILAVKQAALLAVPASKGQM